MVMSEKDPYSILQHGHLENLSRVNDGQRERTNRYDVKPDRNILGVDSDNSEVFPIKALKGFLESAVENF